MSSIDRDAALAAFHRERLVPAAGRRPSWLAPGPDATVQTYWQKRLDSGEGVVAIDFDHLNSALCALWESQGLADLATPILEIAREVEDEREESEVDVFIYQMF